MNSIASEHLSLDYECKTAIIYSVSENNTYLVEIHYQAKSSFLKKGNEPLAFSSLCLAKEAASKNGATCGFQAFENTYQDTGITNQPRFDFLPFEI